MGLRERCPIERGDSSSILPSKRRRAQRPTTAGEDAGAPRETIICSMDHEALPGYALVRDGVRDLRAGVRSAASLLVLIGATRLRGIGVEVPPVEVMEPEHELYLLLAAEDADSAHGRYNALIRELVSFERAAECAA
jgi:hypothetical protein